MNDISYILRYYQIRHEAYSCEVFIPSERHLKHELTFLRKSWTPLLLSYKRMGFSKPVDAMLEVIQMIYE